MPIHAIVKEPLDLEPLFPDRSSKETLGAQLVRRLRSAIERGLFRPSSRLLPSRVLARRLGVSRNTVTFALEQLTAEGYLEARVGVGTFVSAAVIQEVRVQRIVRASRPPLRAARLAEIGERLDAVGSSFGPLRVGAPDFSAFPLRVWQTFERRNLGLAGTHLDYGDSCGIEPLRRAISHHIAQFRGVVAEPDQIIIVEGAQAAFHLIAFAVTQPGQSVAIEDPCYQLARAILAAHDLKLRGVNADRRGLRTSELPPEASLAYVTPSHQFPLGGAMPLARRTALLQWAQRAKSYVIEDDYDSEFDTRPLPALQSLDRNERVIYVGTLSKTLAPGMRTGYVVVPRHLLPSFRVARAITSLGTAAHVQATIADFISHGHFSRHVRRMTAIYERRRRILVGVLTEKLPRTYSVGPAQTGLHVAVVGPSSFDDVKAANALGPGHRVLPISLLRIDRSDCKGLLIGFSSGSDEGVARTAVTIADVLAAG